ADVARDALENLGDELCREERRRDQEQILLRRELQNYREQYVISQSFVQGIFASAGWKLTGWLRAIRQVTRPTTFDQGSLIPWHQLDPDNAALPGTWVAKGPRPVFLTPCFMPAGWLRIQLRMTRDVKGRLGVYAAHTGGLDDCTCLEAAPVH